MKYLIITFKSRNTAMNFFNLLKSKNIICSVITTPSVIGSTCSLSVKTSLDYLPTIRSILNPNSTNVALYIYHPQLNFATKL